MITRAFHRREAGLSLIELMIALTIGLVLLLGLASVFSNSNRTYLDLSRAAHQIENGRFAVQMLSDDIGLAAYYGRFGLSLPAPGALPDPCDITPSTLRTAAALPLQGYDAPAGSPIAACLPDANHLPGTDILVVRRASSRIAAGDPPSTTIAAGALNQYDIYMQANADPNNGANPLVAVATATPTAVFTLLNRDATNLAPVRKYEAHVYFVAPCSIPNGGGTVCTGASDDGGNPIPTLKRLELAVSGTTLEMRVVSLVEGIENFQVDYGIDTDGNGTPDGAYTTAPATIADWRNVVAVQVSVLARNLQPTSGFTDNKTYDMGVAGTVTPGGAYKRHSYNAMIRVINPSARRDS